MHPPVGKALLHLLVQITQVPLHSIECSAVINRKLSLQQFTDKGNAVEWTIARLHHAMILVEKQAAIASKGGQSVPSEKRSFSRDPELAAEAGRKGGQSVAPQSRSFSQNRELAAEAGRKGGEARGGNGDQARGG